MTITVNNFYPVNPTPPTPSPIVSANGLDFITPEMFGATGMHRFGDDEDDTEAVENSINEMIATRKKLIMQRRYRITRGLRVETDNAFEVTQIQMLMPPILNPVAFARGPGIFYDGPDNSDIIYFNGIAQSQVELNVENISGHLNVRGIVVGTDKDHSNVIPSNLNVFDFAVKLCKVGVQGGDFEGEGRRTNLDDNVFKRIVAFNCASALRLDSAAQDNNVIQFFHSTGTHTHAPRDNVMYINAGAGTKIIDGFARVDGIPSGGSAIIAKSSFSCDKFGMEGGSATQVRALTVDAPTFARGQCVINDFHPHHLIQDPAGVTMDLNCVGGVTMVGCRIAGAVNFGPQTAFTEINTTIPTTASSTVPVQGRTRFSTPPV